MADERPWPILPTIVLFFMLQPMRAIALGTIVYLTGLIISRL